MYKGTIEYNIHMDKGVEYCLYEEIMLCRCKPLLRYLID